MHRPYTLKNCPHPEELRYQLPLLPEVDDPEERGCAGCGSWWILNKDRQELSREQSRHLWAESWKIEQRLLAGVDDDPA